MRTVGHAALSDVFQTSIHPPESYQSGEDEPLTPIEHMGHISRVGGMLFLEWSPYLTGQIIQIGGGKIAGR